MAVVLNAFQKAYVRHRVSQELERRDGSARTISDRGFADLMGVHPNTVGNAKRHPAVKDAIDRAIADLDANHDLYMLAMKRRAHEELWANYQSSDGVERRHYLTKLLDVTRDVEEFDDAPDYADLTDEDLAALCLKRDVSPLGMSTAELAALARDAK